jgi:hypothetical protein
MLDKVPMGQIEHQVLALYKKPTKRPIITVVNIIEYTLNPKWTAHSGIMPTFRRFGICQGSWKAIRNLTFSRGSLLSKKTIKVERHIIEKLSKK